MSFNNYSDLSTNVANFLNNPSLTSYLDLLIDLGNRRVRREQQGDQQIWSLLGSPTPNGALQITSQGQQLPAGVRIIKSLWPTAGSNLKPLEETTFDELRTRAANNLDAQGTPQLYALVASVDPSVAGPRLYLWPQPVFDGSYTVDFLFVRDQGNISATNIPALYLYAPDVYLYAALSESAPFLKHDERVPVWEQKYGNALASLNAEPVKQTSGATMQRAKLRPIG